MEKRNENENRNQNPNRSRKRAAEGQEEAEKGRASQEKEKDGVSETETDFTPGEYQFQICQAAAGQSAASGSTFRCQQAELSPSLRGATLQRTA